MQEFANVQLSHLHDLAVVSINRLPAVSDHGCNCNLEKTNAEASRPRIVFFYSASYASAVTLHDPLYLIGISLAINPFSVVSSFYG